MKHFIRLRLKNLTAIGLSLCMAATFAVPFFAYPDQLMADTQDDLDAVNKQLEELRNKQSELNASYGELNEKLSASGEKLSSIEDAVNAKQSEIEDVYKRQPIMPIYGYIDSGSTIYITAKIAHPTTLNNALFPILLSTSLENGRHTDMHAIPIHIALGSPISETISIALDTINVSLMYHLVLAELILNSCLLYTSRCV